MLLALALALLRLVLLCDGVYKGETQEIDLIMDTITRLLVDERMEEENEEDGDELRSFIVLFW